MDQHRNQEGDPPWRSWVRTVAWLLAGVLVAVVIIIYAEQADAVERECFPPQCLLARHGR